VRRGNITISDEYKQNKGQTAVLFLIFSFGHVLQYSPFNLNININALHFIPLSKREGDAAKTSFATPPMLEMSGKWAVRIFEHETKMGRRHSNLHLI